MVANPRFPGSVYIGPSMKNIDQNLVLVFCQKNKNKNKKQYQHFTGFWLTKVGNDYFNIGFKFPDDTCRMYCTNVINNIFMEVTGDHLFVDFHVQIGGVLKFGFGRDVPPRNLKIDPYKYQFFKKK